MTEFKPLSKMTIKDIVGVASGEDIKKKMRNLAEAAGAKGAEIAAIVGEVTGWGGKATQYGDTIFFTGTFIAQNQQDGSRYRSSKIYLPKNVSETIKGAFDTRKTAEDIIKFQLTVTVIEDSSVAVGYKYVVDPARTPEVVNKEAAMASVFDSLPAPQAVKQLETKKKAS